MEGAEDRMIRQLVFTVTSGFHDLLRRTTRLMIEPEDLARDFDPLSAGQWVRLEPGDLTIRMTRFGEGWCEIDDWEALSSTGHLTGPHPARMIRISQYGTCCP